MLAIRLERDRVWKDVFMGSCSVQVRRPLGEVGAGAGCSDELACGVEFDVDGVASGVAAAGHDGPAEAEALLPCPPSIVALLSEKVLLPTIVCPCVL
jgi:hypothetical protein